MQFQRTTARLAHGPAFFLLLATSITACGDDAGGGESGSGTTTGDPDVMAQQEVQIEFKANYGARPLSCGPAVNLGGSTLELSYLSFFVHDLVVFDAEGNRQPVELQEDAWQAQGVALLDFADANGACGNATPETNTSVRGQVPEGDYVGFEFKIGVPADQNHLDAQTLGEGPLADQTMWWSWQAGYRYIRVDLKHKRQGESHDLQFHAGAHACQTPEGNPGGTTCSDLRFFAPSFIGDPNTTQVIVDVQQMLSGIALTKTGGCMSGGELNGIEPSDGTDVCGLLHSAFGLDINASPAATTGQHPALRHL